MQPQTEGPDLRLDALVQWAEEQLGVPLRAAPASADASFRRYFRLALPDGSTRIGMDAPPPQEDCRPFVDIAARLQAVGVPVPTVLAADLSRGFLLLDDLGHHTWLHTLRADTAAADLRRAQEVLLTLQRADARGLPTYDQALLQRELDLFPDWFLARHAVAALGLPLSPQQAPQLHADLQEVGRLLCRRALGQARVFVHRDFMPRNLMEGCFSPGVLDFQDAVLGPISYDVTSLYKDAFISWPEAMVQEGWSHYWQQARARGLPVPERCEDFLVDCDYMGAQRHLKVIGIFARIAYRDGKPRYLTDVPRFFGYLRTVAARQPALAPLQRVLDILQAAGLPEAQAEGRARS